MPTPNSSWVFVLPWVKEHQPQDHQKGMIVMTSGTAQGGPKSTGVKFIFGKLNSNFKGHKAASEGAAKDSARASSIMSGLAATSTGQEPPQVIANHPEAETVIKLGWDTEESLGKSRYQRLGTVIPSDVTKIDSAESVHRLVVGGMSLFGDITNKRVELAEEQDDGQIEKDDYVAPTYGGAAVMSETPEGEELQYPTVKIDPAHPRYQTMNNEVHNYVEVIDDDHLRVRVTRNADPEKWDNQPVADIVISNDRDTVEKMLWQLSEPIEGGWVRNENHIVADKPGEVYHVREARPFVRTWMENARNMAEELEREGKATITSHDEKMWNNSTAALDEKEKVQKTGYYFTGSKRSDGYPLGNGPLPRP